MKNEYIGECKLFFGPAAHPHLHQPTPLRWWQRILVGLGFAAWFTTVIAFGCMIGEILRCE